MQNAVIEKSGMPVHKNLAKYIESVSYDYLRRLNFFRPDYGTCTNARLYR